jgi:hypothetical protein
MTEVEREREQNLDGLAWLFWGSGALRMALREVADASGMAGIEKVERLMHAELDKQTGAHSMDDMSRRGRQIFDREVAKVKAQVSAGTRNPSLP